MSQKRSGYGRNDRRAGDSRLTGYDRDGIGRRIGGADRQTGRGYEADYGRAGRDSGRASRSADYGRSSRDSGRASRGEDYGRSTRESGYASRRGDFDRPSRESGRASRGDYDRATRGSTRAFRRAGYEPEPSRRTSSGRSTEERRAPRQNRTATRRAPRRFSFGRFLAALVGLALLAGAVALTLVNYVFIVRSIEVQGNTTLTDQQVSRASGIGLGTRMGALDESRVRADLEANGQLAFEGLEKKYPHTVILHVRERSRDALILQAGKVLVLDSDGYVVQVRDDLPTDSGDQALFVSGLTPSNYSLGMQIAADDGRRDAMKAVLEALKLRNAGGYVDEIDVSKVKDLRIITRSRMLVLLGDANKMEDKIAWMASALADLEARGELSGELDVSSGTMADFRSIRVVATPAPTYGASIADIINTPEPTPSPTPTPEVEAGEG